MPCAFGAMMTRGSTLEVANRIAVAIAVPVAITKLASATWPSVEIVLRCDWLHDGAALQASYFERVASPKPMPRPSDTTATEPVAIDAMVRWRGWPLITRRTFAIE